MRNRAYIIAPYKEKEKVKSLGARWDPIRKLWFIPEGINKKRFSKWLPKTESDCNFHAIAPIYLIESMESCWKCYKGINVVTIASSGIKTINGEIISDEFIIFSYIEFLLNKLIQFVQRRYPNYFLDYSQTTQSVYYLNHCFCRTIQGDFYLHSEPGRAFFPTSEKECKNIILTKLKHDGAMPIKAEYSLHSDS